MQDPSLQVNWAENTMQRCCAVMYLAQAAGRQLQPDCPLPGLAVLLYRQLYCEGGLYLTVRVGKYPPLRPPNRQPAPEGAAISNLYFPVHCSAI